MMDDYYQKNNREFILDGTRLAAALPPGYRFVLINEAELERMFDPKGVSGRHSSKNLDYMPDLQ